MAECLFCDHKYKGDVCGTPYSWMNLHYAKERREQQALADTGDMKAARRIGQYLHNKKDYQGCMPYVLTAANAVDANAQTALGYKYISGNGIKENKREAARLFQKATEQGHSDAIEGLDKLLKNK